MINGKKYDHEDCRIVLPTGVAVGLTEISYSDSQEIEARYGKGAVPRGWGRKNYEASGSGVMDRDDWNIFEAALALTGKGAFYDHKPFPIVISYANDDCPLVIDTLPAVKITKKDSGYKQGEDNASPVKFDFKILKPIIWNGILAKKS